MTEVHRTEDHVLKVATIKAADFIETHPKLFEFMESDVPRTCRSPGCALGWIHYFSKVKGEKYAPKAYSIDARNLFGIDDDVFYDQMDSLPGSDLWRYGAAACAATLRLYAEKFL